MTFSDIVAHLFLPQESNNHRAKILHPQAYILYMVFFLIFSTGLKIGHRVAPNILGIATNISVSDLLFYTNQKRQQAGLTPLVLNTQLSQAASGKASDMFSNSYWAHFSPDGKSPWDFVVGSGYRYSFAGENLAKDFNDSVSVVDAWMNSSSHRDNILKTEYKDIGFAVVNGTLNGEETTLVVQMFGSSNITQIEPTQFPSTIAEVIPTTTPAIKPVNFEEKSIQNIIVAGVSQTPLIDIKTLNKAVALLLLFLLTLILTLDGIVIWQRKTIRVSGHNIAHLIFIGTLIAVIWLSSQGSIL